MLVLAVFLAWTFDDQLFNTGWGFWQWFIIMLVAFALED